MDTEFLKIFNKIICYIKHYFYNINIIFGIEWILFLGYLILNILDYVTGTIKSKVTHTESSNKGLLGIVKKVCYWILILIAFLISFLLMQIGSKLNINLEFVMLFGWFTLACLIINESRSIIENLVEIGIDVPEILTKGLNVYESVLKSKSKALTNDDKKEGE